MRLRIVQAFQTLARLVIPLLPCCVPYKLKREGSGGRQGILKKKMAAPSSSRRRFFFLALLITLSSSRLLQGRQAVGAQFGANYGRLGDNLPPPEQVVALLRSHGISITMPGISITIPGKEELLLPPTSSPSPSTQRLPPTPEASPPSSSSLAKVSPPSPEASPPSSSSSSLAKVSAWALLFWMAVAAALLVTSF